jgi:P4 family phage/plasmid primase-like protien
LGLYWAYISSDHSRNEAVVMVAAVDKAEILKGLSTYHRPGDVFEIRIPKTRYKTISGYFDNLDNAADAAISHNGEYAIYVTINPTNPRLIARSNNRLKNYAANTTADADIEKLNWLPVDGDPPRPAGISSTDMEHDISIQKIKEIRKWLIEEQGWPESAFVIVDSGNGGYLLARIELDNVKENSDLVARCLDALDFLYTDDTFNVDTTSCNPARILRIPGTLNAKGDEVKDMHHRTAKILYAPDSFDVVPKEKLQALAAMLPKSEQQAKSLAKTNEFDPKAYAEAHGSVVLKVVPWTDPEGGMWTIANLAECPFDPSHNRGEARIGVRSDGKRSFGCYHDSCQDKDWHALKDLWEPERKEAKANAESTGITVIDAIKRLSEVCDDAASKDGAGFSKFDREEHEDLIERSISEGYLSPKEEKTAYRFLKKYKNQLKGLGLEYDKIGHIIRDGEDIDNGLAKINERIPYWIAEHHFKTISDTERLYHYKHGVYLDDGEVILKGIIESEFGDVTSNRIVGDVIGKVKRRTYQDRDSFNNRPIINVKNGLLDLETLDLRPHTPDYLSTSQIDVLYNPTAKAPKISKFLQEVAQPEDIALIEEIIGWLLWPDYNVHKAVMLLGIGRNGKGALLRLITAFLGKRSVSNVTLQDLVTDRFAKADLYGKIANIGGDLPSKDLSDTAAFRNLTGGDDNRAQEKYHPAFNFRNKAKLIFSANVLPRTPDDTYAFFSRWILIEFLNIFDLQKGTADPDLDEKLQTPEELSGLLNIALEGLKRFRANGWKFSYDKTVEDVEVMYKRNANPVYAFLIDECEPGGVTDCIEKTIFYNRFKDYALKHNIRPLSVTKFGELIKDQTEIPVSNYKPWREYGDRPMCWQGVKFKSHSGETVKKAEAEIDSGEFQSIPSIVAPTPILREIELQKENEKKEIGKIGYTQPSTVSTALEEGGQKTGKLNRPTPERERFEAGMKRRHCLKCGRNFPFNLGIHWKDGYLCFDCNRGQAVTELVKDGGQASLDRFLVDEEA